MTRSLVYLGPEGTFTHQAARALAPDGVKLVAMDTLEDVLDALRSGEADWAVAAHTSAAGLIAPTQAALEAGWAEAHARHAIKVSFDLYRRPCDPSALTGLYGHEKALAQVRDYVNANGLQTCAVASNTAGLVRVSADPTPGWGAVGPPGLAEQYGLEVSAKALEGQRSHETGFVLLARRPS